MLSSYAPVISALAAAAALGPPRRRRPRRRPRRRLASLAAASLAAASLAAVVLAGPALGIDDVQGRAHHPPPCRRCRCHRHRHRHRHRLLVDERRRRAVLPVAHLSLLPPWSFARGSFASPVCVSDRVVSSVSYFIIMA